MAPRSEVAPRHPAHLSRTRHPAPWSRAPTREIDPPIASGPARPTPIPVFVDDSGRRRRVGRLVGICVGTLVLGYTAVAALTFVGAPLVGRLAPPGLAQLSRPAGDEGLGVGPGAQESALPPGAARGADPAANPGTAEALAADDDVSELPAPSSTTTSTTPSTTTTTAPPGQGATTSVPAPNSTTPERTHTTGGPPTEPPGKP
jgi:hypothetical protein